MKIGRNDACLCGSGKKYKRCCANKPQPQSSTPEQNSAGEQQRITLGGAIRHFQEHAKKKNAFIEQVGVFLLYSDANGDSWVLELTDSDCIQIASAGKPLKVPLEEDEKTIVVDWSHQFSFRNKALQVTSYKGKKTEILENAPSQQLFAIRRKILKKISPELFDQVHISS